VVSDSVDVDVMYRIKRPGLFTIDGDGRLRAVDTLVEDTYTMAVVARREGPIDTALIVVHADVPGVTTPLITSPPVIESSRSTLILIGVVAAACILFLLLLVICVIFKCRR